MTKPACPVCEHPAGDHDHQYGCNHDGCDCDLSWRDIKQDFWAASFSDMGMPLNPRAALEQVVASTPSPMPEQWPCKNCLSTKPEEEPRCELCRTGGLTRDRS